MRWRVGVAKVGLVAAFVVWLAVSVSCSGPKPVPAPDPASGLQAIPPADPAQYERVTDMRQWRNPYILVRTDGVALYDSADHAELQLKPEELLAALSRLPPENWPYGRVVAAESRARSSEQDGVAIRRNKGIIGGTLAGAHIAVRWVPAE